MKADDFEPGIHVTVLHCHYNPKDRSMRGEVLKIIHVELPFIIVEKTLCRQCVHDSLDTREWSFKKLSDEYVRLAPKAEGGQGPSFEVARA